MSSIPDGPPWGTKCRTSSEIVVVTFFELFTFRPPRWCCSIFLTRSIIDYQWLPDGEHVIIALSSLLESDHVVETDYMGTASRVVIAPEQSFNRRVERLPGTPAGSALVMPESIRYGTTQPLVIWTEGERAGGVKFNSALIPLLERRDIGLLVINGSTTNLGAAFADAVGEIGWADPRQTWLVGADNAELSKGRFHVIDGSDAFVAVAEVLRELKSGRNEGAGHR